MTWEDSTVCEEKEVAVSAGEKENPYVHMLCGKKAHILTEPVPEKSVFCPDCGSKEGKSIIFEPKDGAERVWWCFRCEGKVPRSRLWIPPIAPEGLEGHPAWTPKEWPQVNYNLSDKFRKR